MKIMIMTKNWIGDLLFQFPAIEAIRMQWREAEIVCLTPARCKDLAESNPALSKVLVFDERKEQKSFAARWRFILGMRRLGPWDKAFIFHRSRTRAAVSLLAGTQERIGYDEGRQWLLNKGVSAPSNPVHHVDYFLNMIEKAGVSVRGERNYRFYASEEDAEKMRELLKELDVVPGDYVCFHLGANWEPKRWPPAHFAKAAELIYDKSRLPILVTGSEADRPLVEEMISKIKYAKIKDLVGKTPLGVLGELYRYSRFVISGDSGPMHIASGAGAKVAALFGPTDPRLTGPRGVGQSLVVSYVPPGYDVPWYGELPEDGWLEHISSERLVDAIEAKGWLS